MQIREAVENSEAAEDGTLKDPSNGDKLYKNKNIKEIKNSKNRGNDYSIGRFHENPKDSGNDYSMPGLSHRPSWNRMYSPYKGRFVRVGK